MRRKVKIDFQGKQHDAWEEDFETIREEWNEYLLKDGGTVRVKYIPHKMVRVLQDDGAEMKTPEGDPMILVRGRIELVTSG